MYLIASIVKPKGVREHKQHWRRYLYCSISNDYWVSIFHWMSGDQRLSIGIYGQLPHRYGFLNTRVKLLMKSLRHSSILYHVSIAFQIFFLLLPVHFKFLDRFDARQKNEQIHKHDDMAKKKYQLRIKLATLMRFKDKKRLYFAFSSVSLLFVCRILFYQNLFFSCTATIRCYLRATHAIHTNTVNQEIIALKKKNSCVVWYQLQLNFINLTEDYFAFALKMFVNFY